MDENEVLDELKKLKEEVSKHHVTMQFLVQSSIQQSKRLDVLEGLALAASKLAQLAAETITGHLNALRETLLPPPPSEVEKKKEVHPEFG